MTVTDPRGGITEHLLGHDEMGEHVPVALTFASGGTIVVAHARQAMSNSETLGSVFVLVEGTVEPVLVVPSPKALAKHDWDDVWTAGVERWAISTDGARLVTYWSGAGVELWNPTTRKREHMLRRHDEELEVLAVAIDGGATTVAVLLDGAVELYACATGARLHREEFAETFGDSTLRFEESARDGFLTLVWSRKAPGIDERRELAVPRGTKAKTVKQRTSKKKR